MIFAHSAVPALNQLLLPFLSLVSVPELQRNPTVKDEITHSRQSTVSGLVLLGALCLDADPDEFAAGIGAGGAAALKAAVNDLLARYGPPGRVRTRSPRRRWRRSVRPWGWATEARPSADHYGGVEDPAGTGRAFGPVQRE